MKRGDISNIFCQIIDGYYANKGGISNTKTYNRSASLVDVFVFHQK